MPRPTNAATTRAARHGVGGKHTQPLTGPSVTARHDDPAGHEPPHVGNAPPPVQMTGGHAQIVSNSEIGMAMHVLPSGQALRPHAGYRLSAQSSLVDGRQPHVPRPPGRQASPGGHVPSHSNEPTGPQGALPATHWQSPPTFAQIGVAGGHSPRHAPPVRWPHAAGGGGQLPPHASQQLGQAPTVPPPS